MATEHDTESNAEAIAKVLIELQSNAAARDGANDETHFRRSIVDAEDRLNAALKHARAMAMNMHGESGPGFRNMHEDLQDDYVWALWERIDVACSALDEINAADVKRRFPDLAKETANNEH